MNWRTVVADVAFAFGWAKAEILAEPWDDLLGWHAEIKRIHQAMGGNDG